MQPVPVIVNRRRISAEDSTAIRMHRIVNHDRGPVLPLRRLPPAAQRFRTGRILHHVPSQVTNILGRMSRKVTGMLASRVTVTDVRSIFDAFLRGTPI